MRANADSLLTTAGVAGLLLAFGVSDLGAQTVRGTLYAEGIDTPLDGAFVTLLDAAGERIAADFTATAGHFQLAALAAGRYTVRQAGGGIPRHSPLSIGDASVV